MAGCNYSEFTRINRHYLPTSHSATNIYFRQSSILALRKKFSGPYFPAFILNTDQNDSKCGHFSRSVDVFYLLTYLFFYFFIYLFIYLFICLFIYLLFKIFFTVDLYIVKN